MTYIFILFGIAVVISCFFSFTMYLRDRRHTPSASSPKTGILQDVPSYQLSSWIDDEVAARQLYSKPDISASELADELGISERRLKHTISNAYSKTVAEYLNDRRIQAACRMLRKQQDKSIEEIYTAVGFASLQAFQELFKRTMGQSPDRYRQMTCKPAAQQAE